NGPAAPLKSLGYKKIGRTFFKVDDGLYKVIGTQADKWNSPEKARFTFNLNVVLPFFHETYLGKPFPRDPGTAAWLTTERIGFVTPENRDLWWTVTPGKENPAVAESVTAAL